MAHPGQGVPTREGGRVGGESICARVCNDNGKKGDILALTKGEGGKKNNIEPKNKMCENGVWTKNQLETFINKGGGGA